MATPGPGAVAGAVFIYLYICNSWDSSQAPGPYLLSGVHSANSNQYPPLVEHLKLQVRMNVKSRAVELRTSRHTTDLGALQKGEDFVKAFALGFETQDAIALLRLDHLYATSPLALLAV
jgi:hypothetical protein